MKKKELVGWTNTSWLQDLSKKTKNFWWVKDKPSKFFPNTTIKIKITIEDKKATIEEE